MSRKKLFVKQFNVNFGVLEWAFIQYYVHKSTKNLEQRHVVRRMVRRYVDADRAFDPEDFVTFVKRNLLKQEKDKETREVLEIQAEQYAKERLEGAPPSTTIDRTG